MIYIDSNYWIYWLDPTLPEHRHVTKIMSEAVESGLTTNYVTLLEVAHHLRNLPKGEFLTVMESIKSLSTLTLSEFDAQTASLALDLLPQYAPTGLGGRDCIILSSMQLAGVRNIATHDRAFKGIKGIKVVDDIPLKI